MDHRCPNSVFLDAILENEVLNEIKLLIKINPSTASGLDNVSPKVVKAIANYIVKRLTHIFNLSFLTGIIPNALKIACVTPVYKANSKENFSTYRPISVLPCFSKILEKLYPGCQRYFFSLGATELSGEATKASREATRKNLWHQRITTSLPCRCQFPLIDIRSQSLF